ARRPVGARRHAPRESTAADGAPRKPGPAVRPALRGPAAGAGGAAHLPRPGLRALALGERADAVAGAAHVRAWRQRIRPPAHRLRHRRRAVLAAPGVAAVHASAAPVDAARWPRRLRPGA